MALQTAIGWTNADGTQYHRSDVCTYFLFSGGNPAKLETCTKFYIDLDFTLADLNINWKVDYRLTMKIAYTVFHMRSVFNRYIRTQYGGARLNKIISQSIKDRALYISTDIPYVLFLMLVTIIRYAGERCNKLDLYREGIEKLNITDKLDKAAVFLITENITQSHNLLLKSYDDGHSVCSFKRKSTYTMLHNFTGLNKRIRKLIEDKNTIRINNLKPCARNGQPLHNLIIPFPNQGNVAVHKNYSSYLGMCEINGILKTTAVEKACLFIKPLIEELHA